jgi:hypothetical protein
LAGKQADEEIILITSQTKTAKTTSRPSKRKSKLTVKLTRKERDRFGVWEKTSLNNQERYKRDAPQNARRFF